MTANPLPELQPGDCLLYWGHSIFDWAIAVKTWNRCCHVEVYRGGGVSVASRNGVGVNNYTLRREGLMHVRRPRASFGPLDTEAANKWFLGVQGQGYDWLGILCFTLAVKQGDAKKMFCSEFATSWYRAGGFPAIADDYHADCVAPAQFLQTPALETVWYEDLN